MNTQEAIKALTAAGKTGEVTALLDREGASAARIYEEIRQDHTRTEEYKRWMMANAYTGRRQRVDKELSTMASRVVRVDRDDAERVFGVKGLPGDAASLAISRRDAADRVAGVTVASELRELLRRATRTGDEVLARAVAEKALDNQDADTLNQFIADRPEVDAAVERLWNANRASKDTFGMTMHLSGLRPHELSGMDSGAIESLARTEPTKQPA